MRLRRPLRPPWRSATRSRRMRSCGCDIPRNPGKAPRHRPEALPRRRSDVTHLHTCLGRYASVRYPFCPTKAASTIGTAHAWARLMLATVYGRSHAGPTTRASVPESIRCGGACRVEPRDRRTSPNEKSCAGCR
jgi:hypothetical protein